MEETLGEKEKWRREKRRQINGGEREMEKRDKKRWGGINRGERFEEMREGEMEERDKKR